MRMLKTWIFCLVIMLILAQIPAIQAQESPIQARVDKRVLRSDELLFLTVSINFDGGLTTPPSAPDMDGFTIVSNSSSTAVTVVNGQTTTQIVYEYALRPTAVGYLHIPPISIELNGQTYATERIPVKVEPGSSPPQPGPSLDLNGQDTVENTLDGELFIEASVDNPLPYLGQQLTYILRIYQPLRFVGRLRYEPPAFTGFWHNQDPLEGEDIAERDGQTYRVTELRTILFPTRTGPLEIEPVALQVASRAFSGEVLETERIPVDVKPLPEPAPDTFTGAVGDFTIEADVDVTETAVDEAVTWRVIIQGQGNIDTLPAPTWPDLPGWRAFDQPSRDQSDIVRGQLMGSRTFRQTLVPIEAGQSELPPITYTFFDPNSESYRTVATNPIPISVAPGIAPPPTVVPLTDAQQPLERIGVDIRHIKAAPFELKMQSPPLTASPEYWLSWLVPVALVAGQTIWVRRRRWRSANQSHIRSSRAGKKALQTLSKARKSNADPYRTSEDVLITYITAKLDQPIAGLTHSALASLLVARGLPADQAQRVQNCLAKSEMGRFAPMVNGVEGRELLAETRLIISQMEASLKAVNGKVRR